MQLLGGDGWEALREIEAKLVAEYALGSGTSTVLLVKTVVEHESHKV